MSDELERELRERLHRAILPGAPAGLRASLGSTVRIPVARTRTRDRRRILGGLAVAAALTLGGIAALMAGGPRLTDTAIVPSGEPTTSSVVASASPAVAASASASPSATASTSASPDVPPSETPIATPTAPPVSAWTATADLNEGRSGHTATLLADGRVLVVGGENYGIIGALVTELYDPGSGTWTVTGALAEGRRGHTATRLTDGRVLVVGGWLANVTLDSAEMFDPADGTWSRVGDMGQARGGHSATLLADGRVLVVGGNGSTYGMSSAELFDVETGAWAATADLNDGRGDHSATLLLDGTVLVAGGESNDGPQSFHERYDPGTGSWTPTRFREEPRMGHTATLQADGTVVVAGGHGGVFGTNDALASVVRFDPDTERWTPMGTLTEGRVGHTATLLPDGTLLIVGGLGGEYGQVALATTERFDPATGSSTPSDELDVATSGHSATRLLDDRIFIAGGSDSRTETYASARWFGRLP